MQIAGNGTAVPPSAPIIKAVDIYRIVNAQELLFRNVSLDVFPYPHPSIELNMNLQSHFQQTSLGVSHLFLSGVTSILRHSS